MSDSYNSEILDAEVTPIPAPEGINFGKEVKLDCMLAEVIPFGCSCGYDFTIRGYDIAGDFTEGRLSFDQICKKYHLNGCCRMRLLSPFTTNVVASDINAKVDHVSPNADPVIEDVPGPQSSFDPKAFPPPTLSGSLE